MQTLDFGPKESVEFQEEEEEEEEDGEEGGQLEQIEFHLCQRKK